MRTPLTTHLIIRNDEEWVEEALKSVLPLDGYIFVADIGSTDNSPYICESYGAVVKRLSLNHDLSQVRNLMMKTDKQPWQFYLEPWEKVLTGTDEIKKICTTRGNSQLYRMPVVQGDIITKETRLWHRESGAKFVHPINETILGESQEISAVILQKKVSNRREIHQEIMAKWRERSPLNTNLLYMEACDLLIRKQWKPFLTKAEHYLFQEKQDLMPITMTRYYMAMVLCYAFSQFETATKYIAACIHSRPLMAEYWCLLGDIHYKKKDYERAKVFYENAIDLGSQRPADEWPIEVQKYRKYPQQMIQSCKDVISKSREYLG
jgi:tetratricopeptide (TPR) repeat protein